MGESLLETARIQWRLLTTDLGCSTHLKLAAPCSERPHRLTWLKHPELIFGKWHFAVLVKIATYHMLC